MKIIGRYVLKEHLGPFVFASTALTSLMLLQYIAKRFGELVGKGLPAGVIAEFMALSLPFTVAMTLPMAVLVAVLYAFSRLAAENEITAMKASGVGMRSVLGPVIIGGIVLAMGHLAFLDGVLPAANHRLAVLQLDIFRTKPTFALREQVINPIKEGQLYLRAAHLDKGSSQMRDVVIYDLSDPMRRRTIVADSGMLMVAQNQQDLILTLYHGYMVEVPNTRPAELTRLFYRHDELRVRNVLGGYQQSEANTVSKSNREMSICEMHQAMMAGDFQVRTADYEIESLRAQQQNRPKPTRPARGPGYGLSRVYCALLKGLRPAAAQAQAPAPSQRQSAPQGDSLDVRRKAISKGAQALRMPRPFSSRVDTISRPHSAQSAQLLAQVQEAEYRRAEAVRERNGYDVEIQKKFSLAAACVIFVLIGAPIALRFPRGGVGLVIGVSFAIFGLYYVGLIGGEALAEKGYLPPWLAMWAANIILLIIGFGLASQMGSEATTARGGDFREMMALARLRIFGWLRRMGLPVERRRA
ncbi:MAG TPA: LptF/LptG family permease [Gemmatimonadaceae bacterium]|nr:LptF/LptG family permease [Gemmatimonadaceae bacterium]